ncbi:MAG TPA: PQQ-binding-like beta-propeller repeat protein [Vicinamibacterales bacterium]|jgi:outer membrane protein assembly factor BamB|nr:PQQ-binding-like beta-propeller repeat protein [Vicinamibacterales bacterium]
MLKVLFALAVTIAAASPDAPGEWARFRGPNGSGVAEVSRLPVEFGPSRNLMWKTDLPTGYSSPIISGNRIFLTGLRDGRLVSFAVDRASGKVLWERAAPRSRQEKLDSRNHPASPSAATDGERVFFFFADYGLLAYDVSGKELWRRPLGPFNNIYGMGASPIVVDDVVVLTCDQSIGSFIAAFDRKTGRERWRTPRVEARSGHSTPVIYTPAGGRPQIVVPGSFLLSAYDPRDGKRLWWVGGLSFELKSTPVISGDTLYINGFGSPENQPGALITVMPTAEVFASRDADKDGRLTRDELPTAHARDSLPFFDLNGDKTIDRDEWDYYKAAMASENGMLAITLGGSGDMTATAVRWRYQRGIPQLPSPLLYEHALYMVNDAGGVVTILNPDTGALILQGRLKVPSDRYYASPVAGDGKIYIASESGKVLVLPPGGGLDALAVNDLQDSIYATPALVDKRIYIRTLNSLYCFGLSQ